MHQIIKKSIRAELTDMFPCEFESWRERGDDERHVLSTAVMQFLDTPSGWQVNDEYCCEFGGLFPLQLRYTAQDEQFQLCLCSPDEVCPERLIVLVSADGSFAREVMRVGKFVPDRFNSLLAVAGSYPYVSAFFRYLKGCKRITVKELNLFASVLPAQEQRQLAECR